MLPSASAKSLLRPWSDSPFVPTSGIADQIWGTEACDAGAFTRISSSIALTKNHSRSSTYYMARETFPDFLNDYAAPATLFSRFRF